MQVTFYGAAREVTGSMHFVQSGEDRILLDCGLFQGRRREAAEKNRVLPLDPAILTNVVLSHAHIDHSGRLPLLVGHRFTGRVICTRATADACGYLLRDSAHIQESDAEYLNYKTVRSALRRMEKDGQSAKRNIKRLKGKRHRLNLELIEELLSRYNLERVEPLYTRQQAEDTLECFDGIPYREPVAIGRGLTCTLYDAGHILGSAISVLRFEGNGTRRTLAFTGDLGRFGSPIVKDPTLDFDPEDREVDLLIMESTYGERRHEPVADLKQRMREVLTETVARGGSLLIPSFAYGRTQQMLYILHELYNEGSVPKVPVYVDSPLAVNMTTVYGEHPEVYDRETNRTFLIQGQNPFHFQQLHFTRSVEDSMALMREKSPHIVISASGMCEAGRILHHLRNKIHDERNTILIVGFMARNTLGRRILEMGREYETSGREGHPPVLRFFNKNYPLRAHVEKIGGFSAHGDCDDLLRFVRETNLNPRKIALVHGEEDQSLALAQRLQQGGYAAVVPRQGETLAVG